MDFAEPPYDPVMATSPGRWTRVPSLAIPLIATAVLLAFCLFCVVATDDASGIAWHEEGQVTSREYRDIALTDLEGDGDMEVGGILKEIGGEDPSAEFHTYSGGSWDLMDENISYSGYYNDIAIIDEVVAAGHAGGNSVNAWFYNDLTDEFEFSEPDPDSQIRNWSLSVAIGDINNDSYPDIVAGYKERGIKIFYGNASGGWDIGTSPKTAGMVKSILLADMNNDTHLDIINSHKEWDGNPNDPKKIEIFLGDGEGNWGNVKTVVSDKNLDYSTLACARLDEDEFPDIIAGSDSKEGIDRYIYQPVGSFWERSQVTSRGTYSSLMLEDADGDNIPDIIGSRFDDKGVTIFIGIGDGSFDNEDVGPVQIGNVWTSILYDFDDDGHKDILIANRTGMYFWVQALPEIKNVDVPEAMYAMYESYYLSLEVSSEALMEDIDNLEFVRMRFRHEENITFMLTYNAGSGQFYVEQGTDVVSIDNDNSTMSDLGNGKVHIGYSIRFRWAVPDLDPDAGSSIQAYMKEEGGSTGWIDIDPGPWRVVSSVTVGDLTIPDATPGSGTGGRSEPGSFATFNPGHIVEVSGTVYYNGSDVTIPDGDVSRVEFHSDGLPDAIAFGIENGSFSLNFTLPSAAGIDLQDIETGDFVLWPEVYMDRGEPSFTEIPLPWINITVRSDFVVVTDIWITGEAYYDFNTLTSWQPADEALTIHTHAQYHHTGLAYDGELRLTNGTAGFNTTGRSVDLSFDPKGILTQELIPENDSAFQNDFGPMLRYDLTAIPKAIWDGGAPLILDFAEGSLVNGSEIKAVDAEISIIVSESGLMDPFEARSTGTFVIHWSIIQDENTTINGSDVMDKSWSNQNYTFSYMVPISQAETDNIVKFWFTGNDTVGNDLLSGLWPARCTVDDPGTILVDPRPPATPTGLYTNIGDGYIELRWKPNIEDDLAGYRVYRSTDGENFSKSPISGIDLVRYSYFLDENLQNGKTYYYRITAVDQAVIPNESDYSDIVSDTPEEDEPDDIMALIKENILYAFVIIVVLILLIGTVGIVLKSKVGESPPPTTAGASTPLPSSSYASSSPSATHTPMSPSTSLPPQSSGSYSGQASGATYPAQTAVRHAVKQPMTTPPGPVEQTPGPVEPTPGQNFPAIEWKCPSCTQQVKLLQGERFCTSCGYKIR